VKILAIINQKGGVGKTTTAVNFAVGLVRAGKKVLLIDADSQSNATIALGLQPKHYKEIVCDLFAMLINEVKEKDTVLLRSIVTSKKSATLSVIPATISLSGFDQIVRALPNKQFLLKQLLEEIGMYDYVVIDCPPSLGLMTINALVAAHEVIIPVQPEFFALQGLSQLLDTISFLQKNLNSSLKIGGVICTRFNRRKIHQEVLSCLEERFDTTLFATKIHENISIAEAPSFGKTIFEYNEKSSGSYDFDLLTKEFLNREVRQMSIPVSKSKQKQW